MQLVLLVACLGVALTAAIVAVRFRSELWCVSAAVDTGDTPVLSCRETLNAEFVRIGVAGWVDFLYWPILYLLDAAALAISLVSLSLARAAKRLPKRHRVALVAAAAVTLITIVSSQSLLKDTIDLVSAAVD